MKFNTDIPVICGKCDCKMVLPRGPFSVSYEWDEDLEDDASIDDDDLLEYEVKTECQKCKEVLLASVYIARDSDGGRTPGWASARWTFNWSVDPITFWNAVECGKRSAIWDASKAPLVDQRFA